MAAKQRRVGAIDQGTGSSRFALVDEKGKITLSHQIELKNYFPQPGWVEQDAKEILTSTIKCIEEVMSKASAANQHFEVVGLGVTNQRETTVIWDKHTGEPLYNAVVWSDTRTSSICAELEDKFGSKDHFRPICGLPISEYFSALKIKWLLDNVPAVAKAVKENHALFGTIDTWLIWNLSGGPKGGVHVTDVTNASRTMLMSLATRKWHQPTLEAFGIPASILPEIRSSSEVYGHIHSGALKGVPLSGCLGDQQAALVGQHCLEPGTWKNTYGTGCFLLLNTGDQIVNSKHGLLTTLGFQFGKDGPCYYALEGSVASGGSAIKWLRDQLKLINTAPEITKYAKEVSDTGGMYFVPAFSGLFSPYWRRDARGVAVGITQYSSRAHFCRAVLEAIAYQTKDVLDAMIADSKLDLPLLKVDGGMTIDNVLMQFQSDLLGVPCVRPETMEAAGMVSLSGAAYAAGLAVGYWPNTKELIKATQHTSPLIWKPTFTQQRRDELYAGWKKAVTRSFDWIQEPHKKQLPSKL